MINVLKNKNLEARKAKNKLAATTYQVVIGELERTTKAPSDEQVYAVVRKLIKAAEMFPVPDLQEIAILKELLPAELSDEQIWQEIKSATSIKEAMTLAPAGVDKRRVSTIWNENK